MEKTQDEDKRNKIMDILNLYNKKKVEKIIEKEEEEEFKDAKESKEEILKQESKESDKSEGSGKSEESEESEESGSPKERIINKFYDQFFEVYEALEKNHVKQQVILKNLGTASSEINKILDEYRGIESYKQNLNKRSKEYFDNEILPILINDMSVNYEDIINKFNKRSKNLSYSNLKTLKESINKFLNKVTV